MTSSWEPALVPELLVADLDESLAFWVGMAGFSVRYDRPEERFVYIALGSAHLMLEQEGVGRNWITGALDRPLGRGINLQISVSENVLERILRALSTAHRPLFMQPETRWYCVGSREEVGVRQFLVTDPDGYLARFQASVGHRLTP